MVDYFCWPWFERFPLFKSFFQLDPLPAERFTKLLAWQAEMEKTPGVKATKLSLEYHDHFFKQYASGQKDMDFDRVLTK